MQNNFLLKKILNVHKYLLVLLTWNQMFILMNDYMWTNVPGTQKLDNFAISCQCVQINFGDCMYGK